jgi:hypothetical protein
VDKVLGDARGDAETRSGIFTISNDKIDVLVLNEVGEAVADDLTAGRPDDVADEENAHEAGERSFGRYVKKERTAQPWEARP